MTERRERREAESGAMLALIREGLMAARAAGDAFEAVWRELLEEALSALGHASGLNTERREWATALAETREAWHAAYEGRAHPSERMCQLAAGALAD